MEKKQERIKSVTMVNGAQKAGCWGGEKKKLDDTAKVLCIG